MPSTFSIQEHFGQIDIYLFDQLLKGRIRPGMRIVDAGCGGGRNLVYLLRHGFEVHGVDADPHAIASVRALAGQDGAPRFHQGNIEEMPFPDAWADVVISNAVLHFSRDDAHFMSMLSSMWRVLKPGGLFFCRLASTIGMESQMVRVAGRRFQSPDGAERYLVDAALLQSLTARLGGDWADPLKTTVVQDQRAMTTWVLWKGRDGK